MTAQRRPWALVVAVLAPMVLAGCVSVPTSGPVRLGEPVTGANRGVEKLISSPSAGATPTAIVEGFLAANARPADDYAVARSYLASTVQEEWKPSAGTVVYDDSSVGSRLTATGPSVVLTGPEVGTISGSDLFRSADPGRKLSRQFTLRQEIGEWRIDGVEPGLVLTSTDVQRDYQGLDRYFLNAGKNRLVPDRVLVPQDRPGVQTALVRGLLTGPSEWLAPAVSTAFPAGTQLAIDAVPLVGSTATVDLSTQALTADDATRRLMSAQLVWTLTSLEAVKRVRITVSGQPFSVPGVGNEISRQDFAGVDPNVLGSGSPAYAIVGKKLSILTPDGAQAVPGTLGEGVIRESSAAINLDSTVAAITVAITGAAGTVFTANLQAGSAPLARTRSTSIGSLSYTVGGDLWVVDSASGVVQVIPVAGRASTVAVEGSGRVISVRMARDGARAALVVRGATGGTSLFLARVVTGLQGRRLESPRLVESEVTGVADVAWVDADTLVMIGQSATAPRQVFQVVVGDLGVAKLGGVAGMTSLTAAPGSPILVSAVGGIYESSGVGWTPALAAKSPAYPG